MIHKKASKIKKLEQSAKKFEVNNPKMAARIRGAIAALKGKKE